MAICACVAAVSFAASGVSPLLAQTRLLDREPFDQVVLKAENGGDVLNVAPLQLPQRPLVNVPTEGRLSLELLDRPGEKFDVAWASVAEVRVFEQLLFEEARRLVTDGQFDEAYIYYSRLLTVFPSFPNLNEAVNAFLRHNALALHQARQDERSLALLMTLRERNPADPALPSAVEVVAGEVIQAHLRNQNYAAARGVLDLWQTQFRDVAEAAAQTWQGRFEGAADRQVAEARRLADGKQFVEARKAAQRALDIWPKHAAAASMLDRIAKEFPYVTVGVFEQSPSRPSWRLDNWPALRAGRLTQQLLVEQFGFGAEGGEYRSPFGELSLDDSGLVLRLRMNPAIQFSNAVNAYQVARQLLAVADPASPLYRSDFAEVFARVTVSAGDTVEIHLKRAHVRPEALLQFPPPLDEEASQTATAPKAPFALADNGPSQVVFTSTADGNGPMTTGRMLAIIEQRMSDDESAVAALLAGEIDVLDHVPPWQVPRLRTAPGIRVDAYRLPTVHVLLLNPDRNLLGKREFRRALCYGIDRQMIVDRVLVAGARQPGFEVLSGPFPAGLTLSDPIRYGYNNQIAARPFEPRLAAILATLGWASLHKNSDEKQEGPLPEMPPLVLAHPNDPVARTASQLIQAQLKREGVTIELRPFTADELVRGQLEYDLRYAELAVWEPMIAARQILGQGRLCGDAPSPQTLAALHQLDEADNWKDVRARMGSLHEIVHQDLPLIPLWQTVNHFAHRESISGIGTAPLTLYQNVDEWRMPPGTTVAQFKDN
jgi:ABC-type transport system substrate-binding protein